MRRASNDGEMPSDENEDAKAMKSLGKKSKDEASGWLQDFLPYQIYRVSTLMNLRLQGRLKANGINLSQWRVLSVLRSLGRLNVTQIVENTLMEQPTISRVIVQLEEEGLVARTLSSEDSRISLISLSDKGNLLFDEIAPAAVKHQRTALEGLTESQLDMMRSALALIEANIRQDR